MTLSKNTKLKILILIALLLISTGFKCKCLTQKQKQLLEPLTLQYWGVWNNPSDLSLLISKYRQIHPNINISYRKLRYEEFEQKLLEAYAQNNPPDIISLNSTWLKKYVKNKFIEPMPDKVTMAYQYVKKTLKVKEETIIEEKTTPMLSVNQVKNNFLETVYDNVVINNKIYGLPLSVDTMVLYYNRYLLDQAGIPYPATDWQQFQEHIKKLTFQDPEGNLVQSGTALGTGDNIERSPDILALLMMQNGTQMMEGSSVTFHQIPATLVDREYHPGLEALKFYLDFANPLKEVYCWNNNQPDSLQAFSRGQVAYYFGYSYDLPRIISLSKGKINLGITKMPQITGGKEVNFANFWVETVSSRTKHSDAAWDFILFSTKANNVEGYLNKTKQPTALRSLIDSQLENDDLNIFASQLLTSKTWYYGNDPVTAEAIIKDLINAASEESNIQNTLNLAASRVQQTVR